MPLDRQPCVYILSSGPFGSLFIGITDDLITSLKQHRSGEIADFSSRYKLHQLVRYEVFEDMKTAELRNKQLELWHRQWTVKLIESDNPDWHDLAGELGLPPIE